MHTLMKLSCEEFLEKLASDEPAPGGGGASALVGALGASLASMVGNLTVDKEKFSNVREEVLQLLTITIDLKKELLALVEDDAKVFKAFMSCYKLPKNTDEEKAIRKKAIQEAAKIAAEVPYSVAIKSLLVLETSQKAAEIGNPSVITDATVAALFARAAIRGSIYNVRINLGIIEDENYCKHMETVLLEIGTRAEKIEAKVLQLTDSALKNA